MKKTFPKLAIRIIVVTIIVAVIVLSALLYANWKIPHDTGEYIFDSIEDIPSQKVALVLGASKNLRNGAVNPYFINRIQAAKELYDAGKVKAIVVSGDNGKHSYNEPEDMRVALIGVGVPDSIIYLDYAGFRTLDSIVRMNKIFGQSSFIIVSQQFHNERAIFLAQHYGLTAYGYNAEDVRSRRASRKTNIREKFARVKVFVDFIFDKEPKFLGDPVDINQ
ncbi:hypothetical protein D0T53_01735 [Dysgonomonas sp. 216]|uniref:SanA/YdcF family protein n=1 Tax=Dysgonomonas sp. 216 TaxID=2302934 RepID=UPI0013D26A9A|nr:ElyC/SanA/YdcF family protein [Dysgonomonas sp. 216]NDW17636.1 hypothetical protein [Dysgonomonas sp. 216]